MHAHAEGESNEKQDSEYPLLRAKGESAPLPSEPGAGDDKMDVNSNNKNKKARFHPPQRIKLIVVNGVLQVDPDSLLLVGGRPLHDSYEEVEESTEYTCTPILRPREKSEEWSADDTIKFYGGVQQYGTDFTSMCDEFPNRTRDQLKNKFEKEERERPQLVQAALRTAVPISMNTDDEEQEDGENGEDTLPASTANVGVKPQSIEQEANHDGVHGVISEGGGLQSGVVGVKPRATGEEAKDGKLDGTDKTRKSKAIGLPRREVAPLQRIQLIVVNGTMQVDPNSMILVGRRPPEDLYEEVEESIEPW